MTTKLDFWHETRGYVILENPQYLNYLIEKVIMVITEAVTTSTACDTKDNSQLESCSLEYIVNSLKEVKAFVMQHFLSPQLVFDVMCELKQIVCAAKFCDFLCKIYKKKCQFSPEDNQKVVKVVRQVSDCG